MNARPLAWVGLAVALAAGGSFAAAQDAPAAAKEIMRQLERDVREIQVQAERSVEARKGSALQQLDMLARNLAATGDAAGAEKVRQIAAALGGVRPADAPVAAAGKKCEVLWSTRWYPAVLLDQKDGKFYIKYDGYGDNWNEWVGADRIRGVDPGLKNFAPRGKAQVLWGSSWYPATVLEQKDGKFFVKYDGYGDNWNEWVGADRIKFEGGPAKQGLPVPDGRLPIKPAVGKTAEVLWGGQWWPAVVRQERDGKWLIHYDNHTDTWDEWVGPDRLRLK